MLQLKGYVSLFVTNLVILVAEAGGEFDFFIKSTYNYELCPRQPVYHKHEVETKREASESIRLSADETQTVPLPIRNISVCMNNTGNCIFVKAVNSGSCAWHIYGEYEEAIDPETNQFPHLLIQTITATLHSFSPSLNDRIRVYDGGEADPNTLLVEWSGSITTPQHITSTSNVMWIEFIYDPDKKIPWTEFDLTVYGSIPCGVSFGDPGNNLGTGDIVGGAAAEGFYDFTWQVLVQKDGDFHCGGAIVEDGWVLTSADCVQDTSADELTVVAALYKLSEDWQPEVQKRNVIKMISHPQAQIIHSPIVNNLALIKLDRPLARIEGVVPICLVDTDVRNDFGFISGWSRRGPHGNLLSDALQLSEVYGVLRESCASQYPELAPRLGTDICVTDTERFSKHDCVGDRGGPFAMRFNDEQFALVGISSWRTTTDAECGLSGLPSAYTYIPPFYNWLTSTMANN